MTHTSQAHHVENFDACFQVISTFLDVLQQNFKEDTHYTYPLMPPQANTMYALDEDVAGSMKSYMTTLMNKTCGFSEDEFRFTERASSEKGGLYKLRLEFVDGITFDMIRRIMEKTTMLEERVINLKSAQ